MSENNKGLEQMPNKKKPDQSNDWVAAGILGLILFLTIAGSPGVIERTEKNDTVPTKNIEKTNTTINTPDTQRVERGASLFDTTFLFLKRTIENKR